MSKRRIKCIISIILLLVLSLSTLSIYANSNSDSKDNDYTIMFAQAIKSDGIYAQQSSLLLSEKFINNPREFISQLAVYTSDSKISNTLLDMTASSLYYEYTDIYTDVINDLKTIKDSSKKEKELIKKLEKIIEEIKTEIKDYENLDKKIFENLNYPKYSPVKIDQYINSIEYDEELKAKINIAFAADPEYFVRRLSKETSEKVNRIGKILSSEYLSSKSIKLKDKFDELKINEKEKHVLDILSNKMDNDTISVSSIEQVEKAIIAGTLGKWEIYVYMHVHAYGDRDYVGQGLVLYKPDGYSYWAVPNGTILCRSVSGDDPTVYKGNTPSGTYTGELYGPLSPSSSYGPYKLILTTPVSGQVVDANRSGIWIHGGDPSTDTSKTWYPLRPTYGCVRITNADQKTLAEKVQVLVNLGADSVGTVYMFEWE